MNTPSVVIKKTAKTALGGNLFKGLVAVSVLIFAVFITDFSAVLLGNAVGSRLVTIAAAAIIFLLLIAPLLFGVLRFFWRNLFEMKDDPQLCFYCFSDWGHYLRAVRITLQIAVRLVFAGFLLCLPALILKIMEQPRFYEMIGVTMPEFASSLTIVIDILQIVAAFVLFIISFNYYLVPFLAVADETMRPAEAVALSRRLSRHSAIDFFALLISMLGWIILSAFVIPLIFTLPYLITCYLIHCRFAVAQYNMTVQALQGSVAPTFVG